MLVFTQYLSQVSLTYVLLSQAVKKVEVFYFYTLLETFI